MGRFMKQIFTALSITFLVLSSQAGPRFFNATFESKVLGSLQVSIKVTELPFSTEAVPETKSNIHRDNGQIVNMDCITTARFFEVARMNLKMMSPTQHLLDQTRSVDFSISNSYPMNDSEELCNTSSLTEVTKGRIAFYPLQSEVPVSVNGEILYMSISAMPFPQQIDVTVSGDENRMSLDWLDLFTVSDFYKPSFNYSVYKRINSSTTFLEHGTVFLTLQ